MYLFIYYLFIYFLVDLSGSMVINKNQMYKCHLVKNHKRFGHFFFVFSLEFIYPFKRCASTGKNKLLRFVHRKHFFSE